MKTDRIFKTINWYRTVYGGDDYSIKEEIDQNFGTTTYQVFYEDTYRKVSTQVTDMVVGGKVLETIK